MHKASQFTTRTLEPQELQEKRAPTGPVSLRSAFIVIALLVLVATLIGCQPTELAPTPTPTRTPVLPTPTPTLTATPTPTPTPTITPSPTPTLPPGLILPPKATKSEGWPPLATDLYFLRDGRIWCWLAEGGTLDEIPMSTDLAEDDAVLDFRVTPDKRYIAYITSSGQLYLLDRAQWQQTLIPTSGHLIGQEGPRFEFVPDGRYLVYMAWDVQPNAGRRPPGPAEVSATQFGTVLAVDLEDPRRIQITLGLCQSSERRGCAGFTLSPDGSKVAFSDDRGLWISSLPEAETKLLTPYPEGSSTVWRPQAWSQDNQGLTIDIALAESIGLSLVNVDTGEMAPIPNTECLPECRINAAWGPQGLWMSRNTEGEGCLYRIQPGYGGGPPQIAYQTCQLDAWALHPTDIQPLPDGWVAFLHHGCGQGCPGPAPGLYFLGPDELLRPIALLEDANGSVVWVADGSAFLYLDANGAPQSIGVATGGGFWDVHSQLEGARAFHWGAPPSTP